jgi:hypothetical protein
MENTIISPSAIKSIFENILLDLSEKEVSVIKRRVGYE